MAHHRGGGSGFHLRSRLSRPRILGKSFGLFRCEQEPSPDSGPQAQTVQSLIFYPLQFFDNHVHTVAEKSGKSSEFTLTTFLNELHSSSMTAAEAIYADVEKQVGEDNDKRPTHRGAEILQRGCITLAISHRPICKGRRAGEARA